MNNKFEEASKKERFAFNQFIKLYNLYQSDKYEIFITPDDGYDSYDVLIQEVDLESGIIIKRWIIEIKIRKERATHCGYEEGFILEKKKYNQLKKMKDIDSEKNEILYINFTTEETLVFNLSEIDIEFERKFMNKATMSSKKDKVNKLVSLLNHNDAKRYNYIFDEIQYRNNKYKIESENLINRKKSICKEDRLTIEKILGL